VDDIVSSITDNWPTHATLTPLGADCVKLTTNHAVKMEDGSYKHASNVTVGDVLWPSSTVTDVSTVRDTGALLIVPLTWDSPFLVLDGGIILSVFGYYGGTPPEQQEIHYQSLITPFRELCENDNVSCSQLREVYQGISVVASTFVQQTVNRSSNAVNSINPTQLLQQAAGHRATLQQMNDFITEHQAYMQNITQAMINQYLEEHNITLFNGTYGSGSDGDDTSSVVDDSSASDDMVNIKPEVIGISIAAVVVAILVVIGIVYFVKTRNSALEVGYQQYN